MRIKRWKRKSSRQREHLKNGSYWIRRGWQTKWLLTKRKHFKILFNRLRRSKRMKKGNRKLKKPSVNGAKTKRRWRGHSRETSNRKEVQRKEFSLLPLRS